MYGRAAFYRLSLPVGLAGVLGRLTGTKTKRVAKDLNDPTQKIDLEFHVVQEKRDGANYLLGCTIQSQERLNRDVPYTVIRDRLAFLFLPELKILVVLGRERHINCAIKEMTRLLFPDNKEDLVVFSRTPLSKNAVLDVIMKMREDDPRSWCNAFNAEHGDGRMWNREKTRTDFSLAEGRCVLDHPEAQAEIANAVNISPRYKFYECRHLTPDTYMTHKTMRLSGPNGVVSTSVPFEFERWYGFVVNFLLPNGLIPRSDEYAS